MSLVLYGVCIYNADNGVNFPVFKQVYIQWISYTNYYLQINIPSRVIIIQLKKRYKDIVLSY